VLVNELKGLCLDVELIDSKINEDDGLEDEPEYSEKNGEDVDQI